MEDLSLELGSKDRNGDSIIANLRGNAISLPYLNKNQASWEFF